MSDKPKWFTLRGEQYQYDGVCWWKKESSETLSVPCSQPFRVGDRVKVVRSDTTDLLWTHNMSAMVGLAGPWEVTSVTDTGCVVRGYFFPPHCLEPAEPLPAYIPPAGWRVKGDEEVVTDGDAFSHWYEGHECLAPNKKFGNCGIPGSPVSAVRRKHLPNGGYILTPIVSSPATQAPDVSQESQTDDRPPLDVYLPEIERKINLAAKDRPDLLNWWRAEKERLAIEAGRRMSDV
jgi:hypothetical protein